MSHRKSTSNSQNKSQEHKKICCFCGSKDDDELKYGKFYEHRGIITHYFCLLFSSNMEQKGKDNEGILGFLADDIQKELKRGKRLNCTFCKKHGATVGCIISRCQKKFHLPCGIRNGSLHQFFGEFKSYCINHRPYQKIDERSKKLMNSSDKMLCYICYDEVNTSDTLQTLWAPCCKKNAWFHRTCVQQLALSAGYFFKCPLCNSKKEFQKAMLEYGIYIPCQDASWELVPNAYEELLYRHNRCDAEKCLCPKGRTHRSTNAKWELTLCRLCGSQGIHIACGQLKWANPVWECDECTSIISSTTTSPHTNSVTQEAENSDADSDSSDSDISVGGVSPKCNDSEVLQTIRLKPGPRSFKLLQVKMAKSVASHLTSKSEYICCSSNNSCTKDVSQPCVSINLDTEMEGNAYEMFEEIEETIYESLDEVAEGKLNEKLDENLNKKAEEKLNEKSEDKLHEKSEDKLNENSENKLNKNVEELNLKVNNISPENLGQKVIFKNVQLETNSSNPVQKEIIDILSDDDDTVEIISEKITPVKNSNTLTKRTPKKISSGQSNNEESVKNFPSTSVGNKALFVSIPVKPLIIQNENTDLGIKITTVTTIPQELHEKIQSNSDKNTINLQDKTSNDNQSALNRKRHSAESCNVETSEQRGKKRRMTEFIEKPSIIKSNIYIPEQDLQITRLGNENNVNDEVVQIIDEKEDKVNKNSTCILKQALINAGVVNISQEVDDTWQRKHTFLPIMNMESSSKTLGNKLSGTNVHAFYMTKTSATKMDSNTSSSDCDGDAGAGPAVDPGPGTSEDSDSREFRSATKVGRQRNYICNCANCSASPTPSCYSNNSNSTSSSTSSAYSNRSGLNKNIVPIKDIKFRLYGLNKLEITVQDKYKIDMLLDELNQKGLRQLYSSKTSQSSNYILQTAQEPIDNLSSMSRATKIHSTKDITSFDDAKENLNPSTSLPSENFSSLSEHRTPFSPQNSEGFTSMTKHSQNSTRLDGDVDVQSVRKKPNCKVSIDLNKIGNLLHSRPNLFTKFVENVESNELVDERDKMDIR